MHWIEATARWYAVLALVTWALAPWIRWLGNALLDHGATVARPIAVLAAIYPAWLLSSLGVIAFSTSSVVAVVIVAGLVGWFLTIQTTGLDRFWLRHLLAVEAASALLFVAYIWLRGYTPEILGTEKPMDMAFLASSGRAVTMPPLDPWFAGEPINYYYLGYVLHGTIGRLASVAPETGFNLALATAFSVTLVAAFGVVWNVARPQFGARIASLTGLLAAFMVALAGNLYAPLRLLQDTSAVVAAWWWDSESGIGWRSSRIVCDGLRVDNRCPFPAAETINEFPFFSFLLGDLHPHLMALPYTLVAIALSWNLAQSTDPPERSRAWRRWARVGLSGAIAGALSALNAWDYPTFLVLAAVGVWIGAGATLARAWRPLLVLGVSSLVAWLPFLATYDPPTADPFPTDPAWAESVPGFSTLLSVVGVHLGAHTSLAEYLTIFAIPYGFGITVVGVGLARMSPRISREEVRALFFASAGTIVLGLILSAPVVPLCAIPLVLAAVQLRRGLAVGPQLFALLLYACAWSLSIGVEIFYVRDLFENRMNTLFKFYYQAWTLSALGAALAVVILWVALAKVPWQRAALAGAVLVTIAAGAVYPALASYQWAAQFRSWQGLDGLAYGEAESPHEVAAIRWLSQNAQSGDVILEAAGCSYLPFGRLPFNRVSAFTGIPTVIGWGNHERQWRAGQPANLDEIGVRQSDVGRMTIDPESALLNEYRVRWLFVGDYETGNWQAECETAGPYNGLQAETNPGPSWDEAFQAGDVRLFRRRDR
ncbi:MAG: hypothetical protein H0V00_07250 [Chloroflexia bacterium]|nr:hypothetical protein [Chloroflexia bacterium]